MNYPTLEEVEKADRIQLARWHRFLPSPGLSGTDREPTHDREQEVLSMIDRRFDDLGGMTPAISKQIGW